jgi:O-antigen/teichoic acid export membrane protein
MIQSWTAFCNFGILLKGNTIQITYATIVSVIVITIGYFALIPSFGGYGAAWATVLGFLVRFIWVDWQARKGYDMHLPWAKVIALLAWATALYGISILSPENLLGSFVFRLLLVVLFLVGALMSPLLTQEERYKVLAVVRNPAALKRQS